jgi:hypothetical protein
MAFNIFSTTRFFLFWSIRPNTACFVTTSGSKKYRGSNSGLFPRLQRLFQIAAGGSSTVASNEKGLAISPAPCYFVSLTGSLQRAPAAAAKAGVPTFTLICFGFASSRFGMLSVSTPF